MSGLDDAKTVCAFWSARLPAAGVDACESETDMPVARVDGWLLAMFIMEVTVFAKHCGRD